MTAKGEKYGYLARIKPETLPLLQSLAGGLGFFVSTPGRHYGDPSPGELLDALAAAYKANPTATLASLRKLSVEGGGPPPPRG